MKTFCHFILLYIKKIYTHVFFLEFTENIIPIYYFNKIYFFLLNKLKKWKYFMCVYINFPNLTVD